MAFFYVCCLEALILLIHFYCSPGFLQSGHSVLLPACVVIEMKKGQLLYVGEGHQSV